MANLLVNVMLLLVMGALLEARRPLVDVRRVKQNDSQEPSAVKGGPQLMYCRGKFMPRKYEMSCMIPEEYMVAMWAMDDVPLSNNSKYQQTATVEGGFYNLVLKIDDLDERDVGRYTLNIANNEGTSTEVFYLTDKQACSNSMHCYENPCEFPKKLSCPTIPEAHCVTDMCSTEMEKMCRPAWFLGLEEVECPNVNI